MTKLLEALQGYWGTPTVHRGLQRASLACPDLDDGCQLVSPHSLPRCSRTTGFLQGYRHDSSEKTPMIVRLFNFCLYHVFWCPTGKAMIHSKGQSHVSETYISAWALRAMIHLGPLKWRYITVFFMVHVMTTMNSEEVKTM